MSISEESLQVRYPFLNDVKEEPVEYEHEITSVPHIFMDYPLKMNTNNFKAFRIINKLWESIKEKVKFLKFDPSSLVCTVSAYTHPTANVEQLSAVAMSYIWAITFDDMLEYESQENIKKLNVEFLQKFDTMEPKQAMDYSVYCWMIQHVYLKFKPYMTVNQMRRFREELELYIEGAAEEARIVNTFNELAFEEFLDVRSKTSSFALYELYGEMCNQIDISPYLEDKLFIKNKKAISNLVSYLNDIYSYNKELKANFKGNLVYQVQKRFKCSSKEAMQLSLKILLTEKDIFDKTSISLIQKYRNNDTIKKYVKSMQHWAIGNLVTYKYYTRYTKVNDLAND